MMPIIIMDRYSRQIIKSNPETYFVFGDNIARRGLGGQAKEARGEPNSIGVATKHKPDNSVDAFFTDKPTEMCAVVVDLQKIKSLLDTGHNIVFPKDGLGTGLAMLPQKSPKIFSYILKTIENFKTLYGVSDTL